GPRQEPWQVQGAVLPVVGRHPRRQRHGSDHQRPARPHRRGRRRGRRQEHVVSDPRCAEPGGKQADRNLGGAASNKGPLEAIIERMANVGNAAETAYAVLREAIVTNTFKPGTRLRADDLAGKLGVSKTPVREALRKLQAEALITMRAGNVLTVKEISEQELLEIYYTREALEGM